jgi:TRAP-type C4-dicarboxylate transport system substrate-binding protein
MGRTKDLQIEIRATMSEQTFQGIPEHLRDEMTIKAVEVTNWKDEYKKDEYWTRLNKEFIEALKARQQREEEIRVDLRNG